MVTKAYLANGKDGYDVLAKCNQVCELYVNTTVEDGRKINKFKLLLQDF